MKYHIKIARTETRVIETEAPDKNAAYRQLVEQTPKGWDHINELLTFKDGEETLVDYVEDICEFCGKIIWSNDDSLCTEDGVTLCRKCADEAPRAGDDDGDDE